MKPIALIGGGRWSRTWLQVLYGQNVPVVWFSQHGFKQNQDWLKSNPAYVGVTLTESFEDVLTADVQATIIATASHTHFDFCQKILNHNKPVLVEKPACYNAKQAKVLCDLAAEQSVPVGVNMEFIYASYLQDFNTLLQQNEITPESIEIIWHDPFKEERAGEVKYSDVYTPLMHDHGSHCWSILAVLLGQENAKNIDVEKVIYHENTRVEVHATCGKSRILLSLHRRAQKRERHISINDEARLDFSPEPGTITIHDYKQQNSWRGERPLTASFNAFLGQINHPENTPEWPTSLPNTLAAIEFCSHAQDLLDEAIEEQISIITGIRLENMLVDLYAPKLAEQGKRLPAQSDEDQAAFAEYISQEVLKNQS